MFVDRKENLCLKRRGIDVDHGDAGVLALGREGDHTVVLLAILIGVDIGKRQVAKLGNPRTRELNEVQRATRIEVVDNVETTDTV